MEFLFHVLITAVFLVIIAELFEKVEADTFGSVLVTALILGIVNALINPIVQFLLLPLTLLTLGLFYFVINGIMLYFSASMVSGFRINTVGTAIMASLVLSILNWGFSSLFLAAT